MSGLSCICPKARMRSKDYNSLTTILAISKENHLRSRAEPFDQLLQISTDDHRKKGGKKIMVGHPQDIQIPATARLSNLGPGCNTSCDHMLWWFCVSYLLQMLKQSS
ncbi:hypothetical protein Nepgr_001164 [Nepenthes gracilis]|uniref:Uncharacterized protein n=1 Tax=Nepenthes gracilis TaxID=150966 RepID=A0AAD3P2E1_NEPGR|nr:hypothetical protein Nepgr_001164 [Nepenthes gracilis]